MPIDLKTIQEIQGLSVSSTAQVLNSFFPVVLRIARALSGRADSAEKITRFVMKWAAKAAKTWRNEDAPQRWFLHHTVMASRRFVRRDPHPVKDELVTNSGSDDPEYLAFIRAVRSLPYQQREAFVLHHGEHLNERLLAVAMDMSTNAAGTHLTAATNQLTQIAPSRMEEFIRLMLKAYIQGISQQTTSSTVVDWAVTRYVLPRRIYRVLMQLIRVIIILGVALAIWWLWGKIDWR